MAAHDITVRAIRHYLRGNRPRRITSAPCERLSTLENRMTAIAASVDQSTFLRRVLLVDAATCVATGALLALDAGPLSRLLGLPAELVFYAGVSLFPSAALMLWVALRQSLSRPGAALVIAGNALWVAGSVALLFAAAPTALGHVFVIAQALAVALLAELEFLGLRRAR
jgi:hypothetical protein